MKIIAVFCAVASTMLAFAIGQYCAPAQAQEYPARAVRIIVPLAPGGSTDVAARVTAQELSKRLGQQFLIDNRPGAGATIGTAAAAKATPDGYTLMIVSTSVFAVSPHLYKNVPYDILRDFVPIAAIAVTSEFIIVHPSLPARSIRELVQLAKAKPGEIFYSSSGNGTFNHLMVAMLASMAGIDMVHVPHKGGDASVLSVITGATQVGVDVMPRVGNLVNAGKLRTLAYGGKRRSPFLPDVPTVKESGFPNYEGDQWSGLIAPANTPELVIRKLSSEIAEIQKTPQFRERLSQNGLELLSFPPQGFADFTVAEHARWGKIINVVRPRMD